MSAPAPNAASFAGAADPGNSKVKEWEAENEKRMKAKVDAETEGKKKKREQAQKELAKFYADRKEEITKKKATNRQEEKEWLRIRDTSDSDKNPWERVLTMCTDAKADVPGPDTSRFKSLLINLKAE